MNILIVFVILCNMASYGHSAPILEYSGEAGQLVDDPEFNLSVENSQSLIKKVLDAIPETHASCIHSETLILNSSSENRKLQYLAINLGIPSAPTLKALTDNFTLETCLSRMSEGLQVHQDLLRAVVQRLANTESITALLTDVRDLRVQINRVRLPVKRLIHHARIHSIIKSIGFKYCSDINADLLEFFVSPDAESGPSGGEPGGGAAHSHKPGLSSHWGL
uniref:Uncharacterized protein n=1 Tax=Hucho hucho TaxID=62062 RepID=A0A4W5QCI6_9TELE